MAANPDPDAALMLRVKKGDTVAFTELVEKYKQPVMNLVFRMLKDSTEAEDVAQTVFVQVYKSAARYESSARFSTWLFTIARNLSLNEIRRRSRRPADSMDAPAPDQEDHASRQYQDEKTASAPDAVARRGGPTRSPTVPSRHRPSPRAPRGCGPPAGTCWLSRSSASPHRRGG